jgi:hypothetical protein
VRSERGYFQQRAEAEIETACRAPHPKAVEAHYLMASHYLDLAHDALDAGQLRDCMTAPEELSPALRAPAGSQCVQDV